MLKVKFVDQALARAWGNGGISMLESPAAASFSRFVAKHDLTFRPQFDLDPDIIDRVEAKAAENSGIAQPDLQGMYFVKAGAADNIVSAHAITVAMNSHPAVEFANLYSLNDAPPPPGDIAPPTPDFRGNQSWRGLGSETGGASIDYAWGYHGRGEGVRIFDIEQAYNPAHEDLVDLGIEDLSVGNPIGPTQTDLDGYIDHGTKTFGVLAAPDNGYGVAGAAPLVTRIGFVSNSTDDDTGLFITCPDPDGTPLQHGADSRNGRAIVIATSELHAGDVILLEAQASISGGTGYTPAETEETVFCTTKLATDAGIIVVGAAGNIPEGGGPAQDLDANVSALNTWHSWGDSGAIIVGAGEPNTEHRKMSFSAYGTRVDVQAWGLNVITTSTGTPTAGADPDQYYGDFGGTSSASAVVAGTCLAVQSARFARLGSSGKLDSVQMRDLLESTGNPQTLGGPYPGSIGPAVDAQRAIDSFIPEIEPEKVSNSTLPIHYSFAGQTMAALKAWDPIRSANLGIASIDNNALLLTNAQPSIVNVSTHAIADWHLAFAEPTENVLLQFTHRVLQDTYDGAGIDEYLGMADADGVFISDDGESWTRIHLAGFESQTPGDGDMKYIVSLDAAAIQAGISLDETAIVRLRFQHYGPNDTSGTPDGRIFDDVMLFQDDFGEFALSTADENVTEGGSHSIQVVRLGYTGNSASIDYEMLSQTASRGVDFPTAGCCGTLTFGRGEDQKAITIDTTDDILPENTETFRLVLRNPTNGAGLAMQHETLLRIIDDDQAIPNQRYHFVKADSFEIPAVAAFPGFPSGPAPIELSVSGVTGIVDKVIVNVSDLNHTAPTLLDIILESPQGSYCKLMSDVGEGVSPNSLGNIEFSFEDGAMAMPTDTLLTPGSYAPTDGIPGPDRLLDNTNVGQSNTGALSLFNDEDLNGTWKLHIVESGLGDSASTSVGGGELIGGYELIFETTGFPIISRVVAADPVTVQVFLTGPENITWDIERSGDLKNWTFLSEFTTLGYSVLQQTNLNKNAFGPTQFIRFAKQE